ncbi:hypothetical protein KACHI17_12160 [Sediminibacterium sp. KACHI17]|uniref:Uncharacterized protein n=1 Tax=Sediminibacterium sp. KACHI17 TaxID=1751071 RepID=A0AAT9GIJ7_9BACT
MLGAGYWVLGTGYWVLGTGYWVLGTGYWVLGTGYWVLGNFLAYKITIIFDQFSLIALNIYNLKPST